MTSSYNKGGFDKGELIALTEKLEPFISLLPSDITLIVENLFPHQEWQAMSRHKRRIIGEMVALLVSHNMLPLEFLGTNSSTQRYIKK